MLKGQDRVEQGRDRVGKRLDELDALVRQAISDIL